jgi:alpha-galactosidase
MTTAATPPMGWNSWDCYGTTVTEAEVLANAEFMASRLAAYGWNTIVVDIQWYEPTARAGGYNTDAPVVLDAYGRPQPAPNRFPSAADGRGFGPLAARIHDLGLRFGLHIMRGIPRRAVAQNLPILGTGYRAAAVADRTSTCSWNFDNFGLDHDHPGAQAYYDSLAGLFAEWGVDYVKADDMLAPYHEAEIAGLSQALRGCGRSIVLSLSPGTGLDVERIDHLRANASLWRVSDDLWDRWEDVYAQFDRMARWAPLSRPGSWADADMLPLGRIGIRAERGIDRPSRLTWDEQHTLMTLWCMSRSPLMFGGDLPTSDPDTIDLLTNTDVLAVLNHSSANRQYRRDGDLVIWTAEATDRPARYLALFAVGDEPLDVHLPLDASLPLARDSRVLELWSGAEVAVEDGLRVTLPPHGCALYGVQPATTV